MSVLCFGGVGVFGVYETSIVFYKFYFIAMMSIPYLHPDFLAVHTYIQGFCFNQTTIQGTVERKHKSVQVLQQFSVYMYIFLGNSILRQVISLDLLTAEKTGHWTGMLLLSKDMDLEKSVISAGWNYFTDLTILGTSGCAREEQKFACNKFPVNL